MLRHYAGSARAAVAVSVQWAVVPLADSALKCCMTVCNEAESFLGSESAVTLGQRLMLFRLLELHPQFSRVDAMGGSELYLIDRIIATVNHGWTSYNLVPSTTCMNQILILKTRVVQPSQIDYRLVRYVCMMINQSGG